MSQSGMDTGKANLEQITGVILAGGRGVRMGGQDKGLVRLSGEPLVAHVRERLLPQVGQLLLNANRSAEPYARLGFDIIPDQVGGYAGPLAGIQTGLASAPTEWVLFSACDTPWIPEDLTQRLWQAAVSSRDGVAVAHDGERMQWLSCLVRKDLEPSVIKALAEDIRSMRGWLANLDVAVADFSDQAESFANLNSPEELEQAEKLRA